VEGELPKDGLAAYGDDGEDLMLALTRKIVNGEEAEESVEASFGQATPPEGRFESVRAGLWHTCGVNNGSSVACWGEIADSAATVPKSEKSHSRALKITPTGMEVEPGRALPASADLSIAALVATLIEVGSSSRFNNRLLP
jgi:hypothetical protein